MTRHTITPALLLLATLALTGCSSINSLLGRDAPADARKAMKAVNTYVTNYPLELNIFTGRNLNAGAHGKPLGLVVKIFQLRDYRKFERLPLQAFLSPGSVQRKLGNDLIKSRQINVVPRKSYNLVENIKNGVNYLGVVALFRNPARGRWRAVFDTDKSRNSGITIGLNACALTTTRGKLVGHLPGQRDALSMIECPQGD